MISSGFSTRPRKKINPHTSYIVDIYWVYPGRLTWNLKMMVWKMIFLFNWVIFRFHVILPGCISPSYRTPCGGWLQYQYIFSCGSLKTKKHGARFLVPMAFLVGILCLLLCNFLHHQANTRKVALSTSNVYTNIYKYILYMYIYIL